MKTIFNLINCMVGMINFIFKVAIKKEGKFGQDMNKAFKGLIILSIVINTIHYTAEIQNITTKVIVFGVEIILSILYFLFFTAPKIENYYNRWTL
ncbi:hypothetical protein [Tissierella praeacuta]|uniref:hypothetical protein n=1 Tax=Tissierella praeacuta TaxID=43131 RepID=UPI00334251DE